MEKQYQVAAYVKLAKLWERNRNVAVAYHQNYYQDLYSANSVFHLHDVYIDITGQKEIRRRSEMLRLLRDCRFQKINCIAVQTRAYLAANTREFCFLLKYLFDLPQQIEIITEDPSYHIDTVQNEESQRQELRKMAESCVCLDTAAYDRWLRSIVNGVNNLTTRDGGKCDGL